MKPVIKWAGGKRWLIDHQDFQVPEISGRYIEPFFGGGAVFFHLRPNKAILSDTNSRLIETYQALAETPGVVKKKLKAYQAKHSKEYYYSERSRIRTSLTGRAAQFLYLNRTCWNGLYRENLSGKFNVPIGTKTKIFDETEDFYEIANALKNAEIISQDFELTLERAKDGDFVFIDPPYTTAHNTNGFLKYNQKIFDWDDQIRLRDAAYRARNRGAYVYITNAEHQSIYQLYSGAAKITVLNRASIISGMVDGRRKTSELLILI